MRRRRGFSVARSFPVYCIALRRPKVVVKLVSVRVVHEFVGVAPHHGSVVVVNRGHRLRFRLHRHRRLNTRVHLRHGPQVGDVLTKTLIEVHRELHEQLHVALRQPVAVVFEVVEEAEEDIRVVIERQQARLLLAGLQLQQQRDHFGSELM